VARSQKSVVRPSEKQLTKNGLTDDDACLELLTRYSSRGETDEIELNLPHTDGRFSVLLAAAPASVLHVSSGRTTDITCPFGSARPQSVSPAQNFCG
jgi:hypothetical protein